MPEIDLACTCENPACSNVANLRIGAVYRGGELQHWKELYVMIYGIENCVESQTMLDPGSAKQMMWFLIWNYLPGLRPLRWLVNKWDLFLYRRELRQLEREEEKESKNG